MRQPDYPGELVYNEYFDDLKAQDFSIYGLDAQTAYLAKIEVHFNDISLLERDYKLLLGLKMQEVTIAES